MFVLQSESSLAIHSEPMGENERKQKLFHVSQTGVKMEIKRVYPESTLVEHNCCSFRTLGRKEFNKNLRKDCPCSDSPVGN